MTWLITFIIFFTLGYFWIDILEYLGWWKKDKDPDGGNWWQ